MNETTKFSILNIEKIKALGNKDRIRILEYLIEIGPMSWTELQRKLQINPNSLNFHLTKLLHSEFVLREVKENENGRPSTQYTISHEGKMQYQTLSKK
jgi:predicted ArsR family transcriptional regulator